MSADATPPQTTDSPVTVLGYADLESVYDSPTKVGRLAGLLQAHREESTIVAGVGDNTALGTLAVLSEESRAAALPFLEHIQPTVDTLGNHDMDPGPSWVRQWVDRTPQRYVCANLQDDPFDLDDGVVLERNGDRVAVVGVAHPEGISGGAASLAFTDPAAAVSRAADALEPWDHLVVSSHWGNDEVIARETAADVVLGAHVHSRWCERVADTLLVSPAGQGREIVKVTLGTKTRAEFLNVEEGPIDQAATQPYRERLDRLGAEDVVTTVSEPIERSETTRYGRESRAGNFAADAIRRAAETDLALFPAGSIREGPALVDEVTVGDVVSLSPFEGAVRELAVDGATLKTTLAAAAEPHNGYRGWVHFHVAGIHVRWAGDGTLERLTLDGSPVSDDETYHLATTGYVVDTDHFETLRPRHQVATHERVVDALVAHAERGGFKRARREGRIQKARATTQD